MIFKFRHSYKDSKMAQVASSREFVGDSREPSVTGEALGLFAAGLLFSSKPAKTTTKVKPICNIIHILRVFRKYITQNH